MAGATKSSTLLLLLLLIAVAVTSTAGGRDLPEKHEEVYTPQHFFGFWPHFPWFPWILRQKDGAEMKNNAAAIGKERRGELLKADAGTKSP